MFLCCWARASRSLVTSLVTALRSQVATDPAGTLYTPGANRTAALAQVQYGLAVLTGVDYVDVNISATSKHASLAGRSVVAFSLSAAKDVAPVLADSGFASAFAAARR